MSAGVTDDQSRFVAILSKLCAPLDAESAGTALMGMMPLMHDLPPDVWCGAAAEFCGRKFAILPNYARLRRTLMVWWDDHRPRVALAAPTIEHESLSSDAAAAVRAWMAARHTLSERDQATRLDVLRIHVDPAFAYLVEHDAGATAIAKRRGWIREAAGKPLTPDEAHEAVLRVAATLAAVQPPTSRPNNALPALAAQPPAIVPSYLSRDQIQAALNRPPATTTPAQVSGSRAPPAFAFADSDPGDEP